MTTTNLIPGASNGRTFPAEPLTVAECQSMLTCALYDTRPRWTAARMRAAIVLLWRAGLRASEALAVERRDIDFDKAMLRVRDGKGSKTETVALDPDAMAILREWEDARIEHGAKQDDQWLRVPGREPWTYWAMNMAVKRLAKRAGIAKRVSCHQLRHSMASHMADEGMDVRLIQQQLRHSNISITNRYINHLNPRALADAISQRPGFLTDDGAA